MNPSKSQEMYERARRCIPGGTQLLSKRPELFLPGGWPSYYRRAKGVEVEDLDGRRFIDVTLHAVGSCPLGYADPDVEQAVIEAVRSGNMATLNCPEEVELAELLCELHPWADMVRYVRGGGEAMAVAARIARAATGRERIAFSGYHGWHDWYLAANLRDGAALDGHLLPNLPVAGVPRSLAGSVVPFGFGDRESFDRVVAEHGESLAAIAMEPARYSVLPADFLEHVKREAQRIGAVLILDEITSGFRMNLGGFHLKLGVDPDIAVFAKAMSNGYPMGAIIGRRAVMEAVEHTFISSTYWTERIGPTAALATLKKMRDHNVPEHLMAIGRRMRAGWERLASEHGLKIRLKGVDPLPSFAFEHEEATALHTLYTQWMLDEGFLASGAFYASFAHEEAQVDAALAATDRVFGKIATAIAGGTVKDQLRGPVAHSGLRRNED